MQILEKMGYCSLNCTRGRIVRDRALEIKMVDGLPLAEGVLYFDERDRGKIVLGFGMDKCCRTGVPKKPNGCGKVTIEMTPYREIQVL